MSASIREELLHRGSVKDIYRVPSESTGASRLEFRFSDRYSIFDWGTMPNEIPGKGVSLARMGALFFEELQSQGVKTHYLGRGNKSDGFFVKEVWVPRQDVQAYGARPTDTLIPLEVIFRWGVPRGSSLLKRGQGFVEGQKFEVPLLEFTTKLERQDRLLSEPEAIELSCATPGEWKTLLSQTRLIAQLLKQRLSQSELELWDGKLEFAFGKQDPNGDREIVLVDTIGIDELRLVFRGQPVSKELLRQFYLGTEWVQALNLAKQESAENFKKVCTEKYGQVPQPLDERLVQAMSEVYREIAVALEHRRSPQIETQLQYLNERLSLLKAPGPKRILVLGAGGREHALAWRMSQDPGVEIVYVMPGNPGMTSGGPGAPVRPLLKQMNPDECASFCLGEKIDLVVVGPEKFLMDGWVERLRAQSVSVFGVSQAAALLEGSKAFSKDLMQSQSVPTAQYLKIKKQGEINEALLKAQNWRGVVIKLSGPALGKGVVVTASVHEARLELERMFLEQPSGIEDGIVLEERLTGKERSLFFACLNGKARYLGSACDYKRIFDGDQGPNTGGMGAVSPAPHLDPAWIRRIEETVVLPVLQGMEKQGRSYSGVLFVGMMGDSVLEFNVRWGDPETQALLPLIQGHLSRLFLSIAQNDERAFLDEPIAQRSACSIHVVKAAKGYPGSAGQKVDSGQNIRFQKNEPSEIGLTSTSRYLGSGQQWFFAGISTSPEGWVSSGGRVLGLTAWGFDPEAVRQSCYEKLGEIQFLGEQLRTDIGIHPGGRA